jgi:hypothetical protein
MLFAYFAALYSTAKVWWCLNSVVVKENRIVSVVGTSRIEKRSVRSISFRIWHRWTTGQALLVSRTTERVELLRCRYHPASCTLAREVSAVPASVLDHGRNGLLTLIICATRFGIDDAGEASVWKQSGGVEHRQRILQGIGIRIFATV